MPPLDTLVAELDQQVRALHAQVPSDQRAAMVLRQVRKAIVEELSANIAQALKSGALATCWADAKAAAVKQIDGGEAELGALAALLHEQVQRAARQLEVASYALDEGALMASARAGAFELVIGRIASIQLEAQPKRCADSWHTVYGIVDGLCPTCGVREKAAPLA